MITNCPTLRRGQELYSATGTSFPFCAGAGALSVDLPRELGERGRVSSATGVMEFPGDAVNKVYERQLSGALSRRGDAFRFFSVLLGSSALENLLGRVAFGRSLGLGRIPGVVWLNAVFLLLTFGEFRFGFSEGAICVL